MKKITVQQNYTSAYSVFLELDNERMTSPNTIYINFTRFRRVVNNLTIKDLKYETNIHNTVI